MTDVTQILGQIREGDFSSAERLLPLVYDQLRKLAAVRMASERPDHTLQATALVHEAYARLVSPDNGQHWESRGYFFNAAAVAMRRILVDYARSRNAQKRNGGGQRVSLSKISVEEPLHLEEVLDLHVALEKLEQTDAQKAQVVNLRYFAGLSIEDTANCLGISADTVTRDWRYARAWLGREMKNDEDISE